MIRPNQKIETVRRFSAPLVPRTALRRLHKINAGAVIGARGTGRMAEVSDGGNGTVDSGGRVDWRWL